MAGRVNVLPDTDTRRCALDAVPFDPAKVTGKPVGIGTFTFADGNNATFAYALDGVSQTKHVTRQIFSPPGTLCK